MLVLLTSKWRNSFNNNWRLCSLYSTHQTLYAMDDFLQAQAFLQTIVKKLNRSTVDLIKNY